MDETTTVRLRANPVLFRIAAPRKVLWPRKLLGSRSDVRILDVGCGNHSVTYFKAAFPRGTYTGVDKNVYNNTPDELARMDSFVQMDLDHSTLNAIPDASFDLVVLNHVLEHLAKGTRLIPDAARKLRPGGLLYVAYPTPRSVDFPPRRGTLNFYDEETHITIIQPEQVRSALRETGMEVVFTGAPQTPLRLLMMLVLISFSPFLGGVTGPMLWELYRFEEVAIARRPSESVVGSS